MIILSLSKILCFLGKHRWEYREEDFDLVWHPPIETNLSGLSIQPKNIGRVRLQTRICKVCMKKQRENSYTTLHDKIYLWKDCLLNKVEKREQSIRKILGEGD